MDFTDDRALRMVYRAVSTLQGSIMDEEVEAPLEALESDDSAEDEQSLGDGASGSTNSKVDHS